MKRLWAPWRMKYIKHFKKAKGCLFCRILSSKKDEKNLLFLRSEYCFALLNLYPYNNGHVMVSPNRHVKSLEFLTKEEISNLLDTVTRVKLLLDHILKAEGYNIGFNIGQAGGAGFDQHLHVHIVPRWRGDTNFMPVVADTKIISQALKDLYRKLIKRLK